MRIRVLVCALALAGAALSFLHLNPRTPFDPFASAPRERLHWLESPAKLRNAIAEFELMAEDPWQIYNDASQESAARELEYLRANYPEAFQ